MTNADRIARKEARARSAARIAAAHVEAQSAVAANACPCCGRPVKRNLALTGWVQCAAFGGACGWQGFTR